MGAILSRTPRSSSETYMVPLSTAMCKEGGLLSGKKNVRVYLSVGGEFIFYKVVKLPNHNGPILRFKKGDKLGYVNVFAILPPEPQLAKDKF